ncbi:uncharacterized protein LOC122711920 [Apis laboriosa]|uniref:uncharacterized protein LOC122711920 n=1 Tax=Apis laboriosa TaxID=183418 RepID=UPI001CC54EBB|nr:uncharacterized protein LOC122711920 [Apis laboriosa]
MEFWNFIRNIFGGNNSDKFNKRFADCEDNYNGDNFGNSIWQIDVYDNPRYFGRNNHFNIFSDPLQITRYFESQIENIMMNFIYGFHNEDNDANTNIFLFGPSNAPSQRENLRDKMLKPNNNQTGLKLDTDLDGKITVDNFSNIWDEHDKSKFEISRPRIFGKSMRKEYIRKADGTIEQKQIIKDYEGNEETMISQQIGDKIHTIVTKIDKNGVEIKTEEFCDVNECDLFGKKKLSTNENSNFLDSDLNFFSWDKFFKPNPKL